ncbi:hypothetical protein PsYK624_001610 [Phanerochaete sordida]|uniref:Uncharacterized protein n=1 Tax=Phanerochaete sordida TaxID=48140 RepID=A0A9P3L6I9_9APHY|nr:hypothetical protein PsYK624_001610 [Phanerochaete sordida]
MHASWHALILKLAGNTGGLLDSTSGFLSAWSSNALTYGRRQLLLSSSFPCALRPAYFEPYRARLLPPSKPTSTLLPRRATISIPLRDASGTLRARRPSKVLTKPLGARPPAARVGPVARLLGGRRPSVLRALAPRVPGSRCTSAAPAACSRTAETASRAPRPPASPCVPRSRNQDHQQLLRPSRAAQTCAAASLVAPPPASATRTCLHGRLPARSSICSQLPSPDHLAPPPFLGPPRRFSLAAAAFLAELRRRRALASHALAGARRAWLVVAGLRCPSGPARAGRRAPRGRDRAARRGAAPAGVTTTALARAAPGRARAARDCAARVRGCAASRREPRAGAPAPSRRRVRR